MIAQVQKWLFFCISVLICKNSEDIPFISKELSKVILDYDLDMQISDFGYFDYRDNLMVNIYGNSSCTEVYVGNFVFTAMKFLTELFSSIDSNPFLQ